MLGRLVSCLVVASCLAGIAACSGDSDDRAPQVIEVQAGESIQAAVDRARAGDLVLVQPGVYHEAVVIDRAGVSLRGVDRNTVVLDGQGELGNGILVMADGVSVENLTVHHYTVNGVVFNGVGESGDEQQLTGFRIAYVTAYDNGLYGLYAFQATDGVIVDSYASGHQDSGIYVGQCGNPFRGDESTGTTPADPAPCNVLVQRTTAELNAVGFEGTNASQVWVVESVFRNNRIGITPNSQSLERRPPATEAVIVGNLVIDNDTADAPEQGSGGFGLGIAVGSGVGNLILRNRVIGHDGIGITVTLLDRFTPLQNRVEGNVLADNSVDLAYWLTGGPTDSHGNCFVGNDFITSSPEDIETVLPCDKVVIIDAPVLELLRSPAGPKPFDVPAPPEQPTMPGDVRAFPAKPSFTEPDVDAIQVPPAP